MKPGLQRIEATLDQLETQSGDSHPPETQLMAEGISVSGSEKRQVVSSGTAPKVGVVPKPVQKQAGLMQSQVMQSQVMQSQVTQPQGKSVTIKPFPLPKDAQSPSSGTSSTSSASPGQA
ncbi:MAG TPA: hypothetical protein V6C65_14035, partial [Allocoleopsis sp.]